MSDPIKELEKTCKIIGEPCENLVKDRKEKKIDELTFVRKYFDMLDEMPNGIKKKKVLTELDKFKMSQEEISFSDKPTESEIKSE